MTEKEGKKSEGRAMFASRSAPLKKRIVSSTTESDSGVTTD